MIHPQLGYDPADQFWYSRDLVEVLLPWAVDGPEPPAAGPERGSRSQDPAEGGNMLAMIVDVRRALARLPAHHAHAMFGALQNDQAVPTVVLDWIVDLLGGPRPR